jgi:hypothetical protein
MCALNISEPISAAAAASLPYYKERHIIINFFPNAQGVFRLSAERRLFCFRLLFRQIVIT